MAIASSKKVSQRDKKSHYSDIFNAIRQRKVDFPLTKENEELLRKEGATDEFIEVIRKNSPPLILPTPTQLPTSTPVSTSAVNKEKPETTRNLPNIGGTYSINIEILGQPLPGTMVLTHQGSILTGSLQTQFGTTQIKDGKITPDGFSYSATVDFQEQALDIFVKGTVAGNRISGTIISPQGAIPFSGTKNSKDSEVSTTTSAQSQLPKPAYLTYLEAGNKCFDEFNFDRAIEEYNKVLELDPQNVNALIQRGYARHYKADSDFDFADYNSAVKINPTLYSEPNMICVFYDTRRDNPDYVIENRNKRNQRPTPTPTFRDSLNYVIENCNKAISAKPDFSLFYYKRANAYRQKQNYEQAVTDYSKAIELYQNFYSSYQNRASVYEKLGLKNLADLDRKKARELAKAIEANTQLNRNSTNLSIASGGFVGQVSDKNKKPITGAAITITNKFNGFSVFTRTDEKGTFSRNGLPPGLYKIEVSAPGYKNVKVEQMIVAARSTEVFSPLLELEREQ
jgi:tetratricopeptide (TPR) repeat protein